jgi:hypothetical protein
MVHGQYTIQAIAVAAAATMRVLQDQAQNVVGTFFSAAASRLILPIAQIAAFTDTKKASA